MQKINSEVTDKAQEMQGSNPGNIPAPTQAERRRIPMTTPLRKLEVPMIPGYHTQWIRGTKERLNQALNAGYEFVQEYEVQMHNMDLGGDAKHDGNSDLGTRVSTSDKSGELDGGQAINLYLMKQRKEYYDEDKGILQARNDSVVDTLVGHLQEGAKFGGREGAPAPAETPEDARQRYVGKGTKIPEFLRRKPDRSL